MQKLFGDDTGDHEPPSSTKPDINNNKNDIVVQHHDGPTQWLETVAEADVVERDKKVGAGRQQRWCLAGWKKIETREGEEKMGEGNTIHLILCTRCITHLTL